jgi:thiol-disulfide isomerase/thioredoxin
MYMSSITSVIYKDYVQPYQRRILVITLIIIFALAGYYAYRTMATPYVDGSQSTDVANYNKREKEAVIYFFYADWCPHCKTAKPEWTSFQKAYNNKSVNDYTIKCILVNCTEETAENSKIIQKYSIDSYPTVKMLRDGTIIDFDSKITEGSLEQFITLATQK